MTRVEQLAYLVAKGRIALEQVAEDYRVAVAALIKNGEGTKHESH